MSKPKTNLHMNTDFINLTNENLTDEHLCCIIRSKKSQPGTLYINKVLLNGKKFNQYRITHDELVHSQRILFDLK